MQLAELQARVHARLPAPFASQPPDIRVYDDEIVIVLHADTTPAPEGTESQRDAELAWIRQQREQTRSLRMQLADELQAVLRRHVAWGMRAGSSEMLFTTRSAPVMTRLGRAEREVLDTLVAAGVAETRSSALAYIVRAFAVEHAEWLDEVREAIAHVQRIRSRLQVSSRPGAPEEPPPVPPAEQEHGSSDEEL